MFMKYKKLGLIVGKGTLPRLVIKEIEKQGGQVFIIKLKGMSDQENYDEYVHTSSYIGCLKEAFDFFKKNSVKDIAFAGKINKPSLTTLTNVDEMGRILVKRLLKNKLFGDDKVLRTVVDFFEEYGFNIVDISSIIKYDMARKGFMGSQTFQLKEYNSDILLGKNVLQKISKFDIGQSIVVQNGLVLGIEGLEGTDVLIERCGKLAYKNEPQKPILVKIKKKSQTRKADLPTIGINTIKNLHKNGFDGIAVENKSVIILEKEKVIELANKYNIFIYGF